MAYEKQTWSTGDTVTAAKLNHIEDGIAENNKYIVTLTPTALDYSGTMDKTVAEINAAYEAGMEIWFRIAHNGDGYLVPMKAVYENHETTFPSFNCEVVIGGGLDMIIFVGTGSTDTGTKDTYSASIYSLTPAS